jgi:murein DD-endopeptidase MepM/ murein hydrolase activator NlpD
MILRTVGFAILGFSLSSLISCGSMNKDKVNRDPASDEIEEDIEPPTMPGYPSAQPGGINPADSLTQTSVPHSYFDWPVDEARLTRGYFSEPRRVRGTRHKMRAHWGIDLAAPKGTAVYAAHDGTVIYVGRAFKGYGRLVMIEGKKGWATLYAHLSKAHVHEGQRVHRGQRIADMGSTGRSTGPHLHFEIRTMRGPVDPLGYLPNGAMVAKRAEKDRRQVLDMAHLEADSETN